MAEYLSPGVYVEEIDAGPKPIEGVSTSTAGAVGVTSRGPTSGKPLLVTSFLDFERKFGSFLPEPEAAMINAWELNAAEGGRWWQFPLSVKGFFDNGGQRLYVKRASSSTAKTASLLLARGVIAEIVRDAPAGSTELRLRHTIGIENTTVIRVFVDGVDIGAFTVASYTSAGVIVLTAPVGPELVAGRDFVQIVARAATPGPAPEVHLTVRAKASGDWGGNEVADNGITAGNGLRVRVRPVVGASLKMMASPTAGGAKATTATRTLSAAGATIIDVVSAAGFALQNRVTIDSAEYTINNIIAGQFDIPGPGVPAGGFAAGTLIQETPALGPPQPRGQVAVAASVGDTTIRVTDLTGLANGDSITIGGNNYLISNVTAAPAFVLNNPVPSGVTWDPGTPISRLRPVIDPAHLDIINVQNAAQLYAGAIVELDTGTNKEVFTVDSIAGDAVTLSGNPANAYFENYRVRPIEGEVAVQYRRNQVISEQETFSNLRFVDDGSMNYIVRHVNEVSQLIDLEAGADFAGSVSQLSELPIIPAPAVGPQRFWGDLSGGRDNLDGLTVDDFAGVEGGSDGSTGIQSLEYIDQISICLAPGMWSSTVHAALIIHCETLKDRFAILDPPDDLDIEGIREFREPIDTKYAALYYPWLVARDPSLKRDVHLAPSALMAGVYARVDVERGVHKAPANEVVRGIRTKDGFVRDVSKREQDMLNPQNINVLKSFPGRGNRVWGARTLASDSDWKYINVRRLFIMVEESIDEGTQWVVFEPNDEPLWARVRQTITNFLTSVWRTGALQGSKPDEAFFVKCDRTTMTQDDIDNGRLICVIGIAPVKPAEFVIFRIQQKTLDTKS
jgi:phage tail sheath protein FI